MGIYKKVGASFNKLLTKNKLNKYKTHKGFDLMTPKGEKIRFSDNLKHKPVNVDETLTENDKNQIRWLKKEFKIGSDSND